MKININLGPIHLNEDVPMPESTLGKIVLGTAVGAGVGAAVAAALPFAAVGAVGAGGVGIGAAAASVGLGTGAAAGGGGTLAYLWGKDSGLEEAKREVAE